jgi:hypothetical protein
MHAQNEDLFFKKGVKKNILPVRTQPGEEGRASWRTDKRKIVFL